MRRGQVVGKSSYRGALLVVCPEERQALVGKHLCGDLQVCQHGRRQYHGYVRRVNELDWPPARAELAAEEAYGHRYFYAHRLGEHHYEKHHQRRDEREEQYERLVGLARAYVGHHAGYEPRRPFLRRRQGPGRGERVEHPYHYR